MASHFNKQIHLSKGLKLLSLDGGGVKGISSLVILDAIMNKLRDHHKLKDTPRHYDCFDLAGGTSTGGLIALLLFRLQMTTSDAIDKFREIAKNLFSPRVFGMNLHDDFGTLGLWLGNAYVHWATLIGSSRFSAEPLQRAIDDVLKEKSPHEEDKSLGGESSLLRDEEYGAGKMFMCGTRIDRRESVLFRSYTAPKDAGSSEFENIDIGSAACATSAAPTLLPSVSVLDVDFWDGGMLNNNPINQVWGARYDLGTPPRSVEQTTDDIAEEPVVSSVVSIGTGRNIGRVVLPEGLVNTIFASLAFVTNTNAKHEDFRRDLERQNLRKPKGMLTKYFRFDAVKGESFNIDDWQRIKDIKEETENWLRTDEAQNLFGECVEALSG